MRFHIDSARRENEVSESLAPSATVENAAKVKATYEASWAETRGAIEAEARTGETDLARLLNKAYARSLATRKRPPAPSIIFGREAEMRLSRPTASRATGLPIA